MDFPFCHNKYIQAFLFGKVLTLISNALLDWYGLSTTKCVEWKTYIIINRKNGSILKRAFNWIPGSIYFSLTCVHSKPRTATGNFSFDKKNCIKLVRCWRLIIAFRFFFSFVLTIAFGVLATHQSFLLDFRLLYFHSIVIELVATSLCSNLQALPFSNHK